MSMKRRVYIADHGQFTLFDMNLSLPAIIELTEEQIEYINTSGLYKLEELSGAQTVKATPTLLSVVDGDRFERARTISVNELSFKTPIMGSQYASKAKDAIIVNKNSIYARAAIAQDTNNPVNYTGTNTVNVGKTDSDKTSAPSSIRVNNEVHDLTRAVVSKNSSKKQQHNNNNDGADPFNSNKDDTSSNESSATNKS